MSEAKTSITASDTGLIVEQSAGALLKQAREASGLHIAALAVLLKVPVKKLEALESDRLDLLPDAVFVRALASSVCRTLKIGSTAILARLPQVDAPKLTYQGAGINASFRSPSDGKGPSAWAQVSRPAVLAGMMLLLGALVLIFLPVIKANINETRVEVSDSKTKNIAVEKPMPSAVAAATTPVPLTTLGRSAVSSEPASPMLTAEAMADVSLVRAGTANAALSSDVVVFTAKTESWVEATDAQGRMVLRRTLAAGEVVGASGALPLKVVVGRANATLVEIRGKVFDMSEVAKDNVARFEVK